MAAQLFASFRSAVWVNRANYKSSIARSGRFSILILPLISETIATRSGSPCLAARRDCRVSACQIATPGLLGRKSRRNAFVARPTIGTSLIPRAGLFTGSCQTTCLALSQRAAIARALRVCSRSDGTCVTLQRSAFGLLGVVLGSLPSEVGHCFLTPGSNRFFCADVERVAHNLDHAGLRLADPIREE